MRHEQMDIYNSKLGDRFDSAVQSNDLESQRSMLIDAMQYLKTLPSNQPMYGDHQGGFCLAGELLENVKLHIDSVENRMMDIYNDQCQREHELSQRSLTSYADYMREEHRREMMIDVYGS